MTQYVTTLISTPELNALRALAGKRPLATYLAMVVDRFWDVKQDYPDPDQVRYGPHVHRVKIGVRNSIYYDLHAMDFSIAEFVRMILQEHLKSEGVEL